MDLRNVYGYQRLWSSSYLENTQSFQDSFNLSFVVKMWALGCGNMTKLVSGVNKSISPQDKLKQVRLSQFSRLSEKEVQAPSYIFITLKKSLKKP